MKKKIINGGRNDDHDVRVHINYLGRQQRVVVETLHADHKLVLRVHYVVHKAAVDQEPIGAAVHSHALRNFAIAEAPHVRVALVEEAVQALLTNETENSRGGQFSSLPPGGSKLKSQGKLG